MLCAAARMISSKPRSLQAPSGIPAPLACGTQNGPELCGCASGRPMVSCQSARLSLQQAQSIWHPERPSSLSEGVRISMSSGRRECVDISFLTHRVWGCSAALVAAYPRPCSAFLFGERLNDMCLVLGTGFLIAVWGCTFLFMAGT